jgi:hypothetical protein
MWALVGLARNPAVEVDVLWQLLRSDDRQVLRTLAGRPEMPNDLARSLAGHRASWVRSELALNFGVAMGVWRELAADTDPHVRAALAGGRTGITDARNEIPLDEPDPPLPDEVGQALVGDPDPWVRQVMARRKWHTDEVYAVLAIDPVPEVRRSTVKRWRKPPPDVVRNWFTDPETRVEAGWYHVPPADLVPAMLADANVVIRMQAINNAALDLDTATGFARSSDSDVRQLVAANRQAPLAAVLPLADDPELSVRRMLMLRPDLPEDVRERIRRSIGPAHDRNAAPWLLPEVASLATRLAHLTSPSPLIRRAVAHSTDLPPAAAERLLHDPDPLVRLIMAERYPDTPAEVLLDIARLGVQEAIRLGQHRNFPAATLAEYATSADPSLRGVAAANPHLPVDLVIRLTGDGDTSVRAAAAANPALPAAHIVGMLGDSWPYIAASAASNPALPASAARAIARRT